MTFPAPWFGAGLSPRLDGNSAKFVSVHPPSGWSVASLLVAFTFTITLTSSVLPSVYVTLTVAVWLSPTLSGVTPTSTFLNTPPSGFVPFTAFNTALFLSCSEVPWLYVTGVLFGVYFSLSHWSCTVTGTSTSLYEPSEYSTTTFTFAVPSVFGIVPTTVFLAVSGAVTAFVIKFFCSPGVCVDK